MVQTHNHNKYQIVKVFEWAHKLMHASCAGFAWRQVYEWLVAVLIAALMLHKIYSPFSGFILQQNALCMYFKSLCA